MHRWKAKLEGVIGAYGPVALGVWLSLFGLTWAGFAVAIAAGLEVESAGGSASTAVAAYVATQLTKPVRVAATLVLTPLAARLLGRSPVAMTPPDEAGPTPVIGGTPADVAETRPEEGA